MFSVDVESPATLDETLEVSAEEENAFTRARNILFVAELSAYFDHDITIKPEDVEVVSVRTREGTVGEEYSEEWIDSSTAYCIPGAVLTFMNPNWGYGTTNLLTCYQKISTRYPAEKDYTWKHFQPGEGNVVETGEKTI